MAPHLFKCTYTKHFEEKEKEEKSLGLLWPMEGQNLHTTPVLDTQSPTEIDMGHCEIASVIVSASSRL